MAPWWLKDSADEASPDDDSPAADTGEPEDQDDQDDQGGGGSRRRKRRRRRRRRGSGDGRRSGGESQGRDERQQDGASAEDDQKAEGEHKVRGQRNDRDDKGKQKDRGGRRSGGTRERDDRDERDTRDTRLGLDAEAVEALANSVVYAVPEQVAANTDERKIAMFIDFENIALGVRDSDIKNFEINLVLERMLEKGKIIVKRAYADWERYKDHKRPLHEAAIELIDIPQKHYSGKNSADIKMVVDAMDLCYSKEHLDTFVLVSGDSDFSPLVSKLKENDKFVVGIGVKNSSSHLLIDNCDEFIYFEDIWRDAQRAPSLGHLSPKEEECFKLMSDAIVALFRDNKDVIWGSMVKQTMQRKRPSFSEGYYGYSTFSELLEDAERKNIIHLRRDARSGNYIVAGFVTKASKKRR